MVKDLSPRSSVVLQGEVAPKGTHGSAWRSVCSSQLRGVLLTPRGWRPDPRAQEGLRSKELPGPASAVRAESYSTERKRSLTEPSRPFPFVTLKHKMYDLHFATSLFHCLCLVYGDLILLQGCCRCFGYFLLSH